MELSDRHQDVTESSSERYGGPVSDTQRFRGKMVLALILMGFLVVCGRLAQLHLNPDLELSEEERKHIGKVVLTHPRGEIYDRHGLTVATNRDAPSLWADPRKVRQPDDLAQMLSTPLEMDVETLFTKLTATEKDGRPMKFVWLKRWLALSEQQLEELVLAGGGALQIKYESTRYYPQADTASHLLGFVNRVGEASEGVELKFDKFLNVIPGEHLARKDSSRQLLESLTLDYRPAEGGDSIQLTLDSAIQHKLEESLDKRIIECNATAGMGIVIDPYTGAILAMASRPSFDPNNYGSFPPELRKNRALVDVFEPGSAFKIVPAAAALEHNLVTPETMIDCEGGSFNPYGHRIKDFHPLGVEPFSVCFEQSSNIALIKLAAELGPERLDQWIRRFGFGSPTSRDFTLNLGGKPTSLESAGIFRPRNKWNRLSMGSLPMGQEIAVTMPQMAKAYAIIANGGYAVEPYFVERAVSREGRTTYQFPHATPQRVISEKTSATMRKLCRQVVETGTGSKADIPEYTVAGKTGTAQMAKKNGRGYDADRFTTVFAGFAPAENPAVVCVIVVQEPMIRLHYGGYVCGPVFEQVVREALVRLNVPPDRPENAPKPEEGEEEKKSAPVEDPDTMVARLDEADQVLLEDSLENLLEPLDGLSLIAPAPRLTTGEPVKRLPDFTGMNKRQAAEQLRSLGVPWDVVGAGWVTRQTPEPGTPIYEVVLCSLEFERHVKTVLPEESTADAPPAAQQADTPAAENVEEEVTTNPAPAKNAAPETDLEPV